MSNSDSAVLEMTNIIKVFPGVRALDNVSLSIEQSEVMALLGENGAGKSTLVKILSGALRRDGGDVFVDGVSLPMDFTTSEARAKGIGIIYQELSLLGELSVAENIYLTHEPQKNVPGLIDYEDMYKQAKLQLSKLKVDHIDVREKVKHLSLPDKQMVEIAKALATDCNIIIMDEPTTSLTWRETTQLFDVIKTLKAHEVTVIYISHRLDEIFKICDTATILRDGKIVGNLRIDDTSKDEIVSLMTGKQAILHKEPVKNVKKDGKIKVLLEVKDLTDNKSIRDISFCVYENEILGIGGLIGSKRTEMVRMIFGADKLDSGEIYISGEKTAISSPAHAIKCGVGYLSENRKEEGLNQGLSIKENIVGTDWNAVSRLAHINWNKVDGICQDYIQKLNIKGKPDTLVRNLSGGNQQKVAISKWLHAGCRLLIFDEPTRGIDVVAKGEIYEGIRSFAQEGCAAIVISSEAEELVNLCDRIIIMAKGKISLELNKRDISDGHTLASIIMNGGNREDGQPICV